MSDTAYDRVLRFLRDQPEVQLHKTVLWPLFREMGMTHLQYLHGSFERGKDFAYCANDVYGGLEMHVCQVKNSEFSGRASSDANTMGVLNQVVQARELAVINPETNRKEAPRSVVLVTTYALPDKDLADGQGFLEKLHKSSVTIIGPDKLVGLIEKYMPKYFESVAFPGRALSDRLKHYLALHHEHAAFRLRSQRRVESFFVNLSLVPKQSILSHVAMHGADDIENSFNSFTEVPTDAMAAVASAQAVLPLELRTPQLMQLVKVRASLESNSYKRPRLDRTAIADAANKSGRSTIEQPRVAALIDKLSLYLSSHHSRRSPASIAETIDVTSQFEDVLRHLCSLGAASFPPKGSDDGTASANSRRLHDILNTQWYPSGDGDVPCYEFCDVAIHDVEPLCLAHVRSHLCIQGCVGSGKTTLARTLALQAIDDGLKVVYFPCSHIRINSCSLLDEIVSFLGGLAANDATEAALDFTNTADVLIIDGLDEARGFIGDVMQEIARLVDCRPPSQSVSATHAPVIPKDCQLSLRVDRIGEGEYSLTVTGPLTRNQWHRVLYLNDRTDFAQPLRELLNRTFARRVIVTVRSSANVTVPADFSVVQLQSFSDTQMVDFFNRWFEGKQNSATQIMEHLRENPQLMGVCRTPIVATIVAAVHENGLNLPRSKTEVYQRRFELLLGEWDAMREVKGRNRINQQDKYKLLAHLAFEVHNGEKRTFGRDAVEKIWNASMRSAYRDISFDDVLTEFVEGNNVIVDEGDGQLSLGHLSYQEYLAAVGVMFRQKSEMLARRASDPWWREVLLFYVGLTGDMEQIVDQLMSGPGIDGNQGLVELLRVEDKFTASALRDFLDDLNFVDAYEEPELQFVGPEIEDPYLLEDLVDDLDQDGPSGFEDQ